MTQATVVASIAGTAALILSLCLPFVVKPWLQRLGIVDVPSARSSHERPVLRGLGLAVMLAIVGGGITAIVMLSLDAMPVKSDTPASWVTLTCILAISLASGILGFAEDYSGVSVRKRSLLLLTIAFATGLLLTMSVNLSWWLGAIVVIYAVFFVSGYINVANFMDGLNGISGLHGLIAGVTFAILGFFADLDWLFAAGAVLAAGFAGFLPWNLSKPGAFLGDVGSYLLGGATAATSLFALVNGIPLLATIGPMVIYFGDVVVTLVRRVREGKQWDEPHKEHAYQRLQQNGMSHIAASSIAAGFTAITSTLGILTLVLEPVWWIALFAAGVVSLVAYLALPGFIERRRHARVAQMRPGMQE